MRNITYIQADIRADIGATDIGARFITDIHGCTDNSTWTSLILRISKRISARTVRPGMGILKAGQSLPNDTMRSSGL